jgi:hypothetical protein
MARSAVQRARGTTAQHATFTGLNAEVTFDTDKKTLVAHDGATPGGFPLNNHSGFINPASFGVKGDGSTDDTEAFDLAVAACPSGGVVKFNSSKTYKLGQTAIITKPITLDFSGAYIKSATTGIMFRLQQATPDDNADRITIKHVTVIAGTSNPANIVKILYGGINPRLHDFHVQAVTATHSFIWNYASYGLVLDDCKIRNSVSPYGIYCSHSNSNPLILTNAVDINHLDISNLGGLGVYFEGGIATIRGQSVIEGCTGGGIKHGNEAYANKLVVRDLYCEANSNFDISFASTAGGNYSVENCALLSTGITSHIVVGAPTTLTAIGNTFYSGGITGAAPTSYVGINNVQRVAVAGFTGTFDAELADTIRGGMKASIVKPTNRMTQVDVAAGTEAYLVQAQPLSGTAYDELRIAGTYSLPAGLRFVARVWVSRNDTSIIGVVVNDLEEREVMELDVAPGGTGWGVGDIILDGTSGNTCEIVAKISDTKYEIKGRTGVLTLALF